jgi:hypothetical protein
MNRDHPKYNKLVESLIGKGTILKWRENIDSPHFKDNKVTLKVTSLQLKSWGSIYINLSIVGDGRFYDRTLKEDLRSHYDTTYEQQKKSNRFKWDTARTILHQEIKLLGISKQKIFIKRLTFSSPKKR